MALRYVILHHTGVDPSHYDWMFEHAPGSMLVTWRIDQWPIERPMPAVRLRDHRRLYLVYEGDLSEQRGSVMRVGQGECEVEAGADSSWSVRILTGGPPTTLRMRKTSADQWEISPA